MSTPGLHIVMTGSPVEGFEHYGPFKTSEHAVEWAVDHLDSAAGWWVIPLHAPEEP